MKRGFTLFEMIIVVTLIAVITAIAIPSLLKSKSTGNEAATIATLRTLATSQTLYETKYGFYGDFGGLETTGFLDLALKQYGANPLERCGVKEEYIYRLYNVGRYWDCSCGALAWNVTGKRRFFVDVSGVIRCSYPTGLAEGAADDPGPNGWTKTVAENWSPIN